MREAINGVVVLLLGVALMICHRPLAWELVKQQNRFFGFFGFHLGELEKKVGAWVVLLSGVFLVVVGILMLLGVG
jgi:hypothetical protein